MPKFNVDEQTSLFESIEITLEGKTYVIDKMTSNMIIEATKLSKDAQSGDIASVAKQLSIFINEAPEKLQEIDIRKLGAALKFITECFTGQIKGESKNGQEAEVK